MSDTGKGETAAADITNPRDIQGILALGVTAGFLAITAFALSKSANMQDALTVLNVITSPVSLIIGFYFGSKKSAE